MTGTTGFSGCGLRRMVYRHASAYIPVTPAEYPAAVRDELMQCAHVDGCGCRWRSPIPLTCQRNSPV
ncbi:hypothetical protein UA45_11405, partial [Morganella morganii]